MAATIIISGAALPSSSYPMFFYWEYCFSRNLIVGFRSKESLSAKAIQKCFWVLIVSPAVWFFRVTSLKTWCSGLQRVKASWKLTCKASIQMALLTTVCMGVEGEEARTLITLVIWPNCSCSSQVSPRNQQPQHMENYAGKRTRSEVHRWRVEAVVVVLSARHGKLDVKLNLILCNYIE